MPDFCLSWYNPVLGAGAAKGRAAAAADGHEGTCKDPEDAACATNHDTSKPEGGGAPDSLAKRMCYHRMASCMADDAVLSACLDDEDTANDCKHDCA